MKDIDYFGTRGDCDHRLFTRIYTYGVWLRGNRITIAADKVTTKNGELEFWNHRSGTDDDFSDPGSPLDLVATFAPGIWKAFTILCRDGVSNVIQSIEKDEIESKEADQIPANLFG
jgi:hypothetical protein